MNRRLTGGCMRGFASVWVLLSALLIHPGWLQAGEKTDSKPDQAVQQETSSADSLPDLKSEAARLSLEVLTPESLLKAVALCEQVLAKEEGDLETIALLSRICWSLGNHQKDKKRQKAWFDRGRKLGDRLRKLHPDRPEGYYWHSVNHGEWVDRSSLLSKLGAKKIIMGDMEKVLELNDRYDGGGAYIVIGRINYIAPGGSYTKAIECFQKAIELNPRRTTAYLFLGELYLHEHMFDEARGLFMKVITMEIDPRYGIEARDDRQAARKLLLKWTRKNEKYPEQEKITND
jgi:tetratricopeptide (TPR) repeat protein